MIGFVDLREQNVGPQFAFWDSARDQFFEFAGDQAWADEIEFVESFSDEVSNQGESPSGPALARFTDLLPLWVPFQVPVDYSG